MGPEWHNYQVRVKIKSRQKIQRFFKQSEYQFFHIEMFINQVLIQIAFLWCIAQVPDIQARVEVNG